MNRNKLIKITRSVGLTLLFPLLMFAVMFIIVRANGIDYYRYNLEYVEIHTGEYLYYFSCSFSNMAAAEEWKI